MSKKKARLVRVDRFNINQYYNNYNSKSVISNKILKPVATSIKVAKSYNITNCKSLQYSSIYKKCRYLSSKTFDKIESYNYPLYMSSFLISESNLNYNNAYTVYNIKSKNDRDYDETYPKTEN